MTLDTERRAALTDIMAQPDPPDLPERGHRWTQEGHPERFIQIPRLSNIFSLSRIVAREEDEEARTH